MTFTRTLLIAMLAVMAGACARSYQTVALPQHEADLYPVAQRKGGIVVAIDEMRDPARTARYFGVDLTKEGIVPIAVVVSNHGKRRAVVKPTDILLYRGNEIIDPLPPERHHGGLLAKTAFKEAVLGPGETYRGVMFFVLPEPPARRDRFLTAWSAFWEGSARMRIGLTDMETGERLLFGPFTLSHPHSPYLSSYNWR